MHTCSYAQKNMNMCISVSMNLYISMVNAVTDNLPVWCKMYKALHKKNTYNVLFEFHSKYR